MRLLVYDMLVNVNVYVMYMCVNKRIELAQRGIALYRKFMYYYFLLLLCLFLLHSFILDHAMLEDAVVVTRDNFEDHVQDYKDIIENR